MESPKHPYQTLGNHLRYLREQQLQSLAEVSGAVEINEQDLERIESGHERPTEEILLLLISYFKMQDQEAVQLWELAGYDEAANSERRKQEDILQEALSGQKAVVLVMGMDSRTMYTDQAIVEADNAGIVVTFEQQNGKKQAQSVAKVGMSYEQAESVMRQLQTAILQGRYGQGPRLLSPGNDSPK